MQRFQFIDDRGISHVGPARNELACSPQKAGNRKRIVFISQEDGDKPSGIRMMNTDDGNAIALPNKKATGEIYPSRLPDEKN